MGRKVHPIGFRLGIIKDWESRWYAEGRRYAELLEEDRMIRNYIHEQLPDAAIPRVEIERFSQQVNITIHTAKPGIVIGRKGQTVNQLREALSNMTGKRVKIDVAEVKRPELDARLVAQSIAQQIERRVSYRRAMKQAVARAMRMGAKGAMVQVKGRLAGAEMARKETVREGRIPRHTIRANIDYGMAEALTKYGRIGVKVWIYKGDVLPEKKKPVEQPEQALTLGGAESLTPAGGEASAASPAPGASE